MSNTEARSETAIETPTAQGVDMKLEVVVIPVSEVDRAKRFYGALGWRLDADLAVSDHFRIVQFTPPGSPCSIQFGTGLTSATPGSAEVLYLVVSDIEAARAELVDRGIEVSELFHRGDSEGRLSGPDPQRRSYGSFASFSDPDGNGWLLQEVTARLPGRVDATTRHSPRRPSSRARSGVRRPRTASTRSGPASEKRTGRTGTPSTSSGSRPGSRCRRERRLRRHRHRRLNRARHGPETAPREESS
jgi:catechol 2,3-dioxygenase-like lactoylglutathione lyase family enzyme